MTPQHATLLPETKIHQCYLRNVSMAFQTLGCLQLLSLWLSTSMMCSHKVKKKKRKSSGWFLVGFFLMLVYR